MVITFIYDLDEIFRSKIGVFALGYYSDYVRGSRKLKAKDNVERFAFLIFHLLGKAAVFYIHIATQFYFRFAPKEKLKKLLMD